MKKQIAVWKIAIWTNRGLEKLLGGKIAACTNGAFVGSWLAMTAAIGRTSVIYRLFVDCLPVI